jgi:hypothetical protein
VADYWDFTPMYQVPEAVLRSSQELSRLSDGHQSRKDPAVAGFSNLGNDARGDSRGDLGNHFFVIEHGTLDSFSKHVSTRRSPLAIKRIP